jgi:integrase
MTGNAGRDAQNAPSNALTQMTLSRTRELSNSPTAGPRNCVGGCHPPPSDLRHVRPGEEIRLEAAVRREDERSFVEAMSNAIAAPNIQRTSRLPPAMRAIVSAAFVASARSYLLEKKYEVPPRLETLLALTMGSGMLIAEALELTWTQIDKKSGRVVVSRDRGNGTRYQLSEEVLQLLNQLPHLDPARPILRLTRASLEVGWRRACQDAGVVGVTLRDLEYEAQFRHRMRQLR